jgi:hypothetical protein
MVDDVDVIYLFLLLCVSLVLMVQSPLMPFAFVALSRQDGKVKGDPEVGVEIADALAALPHLDSAVAGLEKMGTAATQDLLMTLYLSNLTKAHVKLADRIHSISAQSL